MKKAHLRPMIMPSLDPAQLLKLCRSAKAPTAILCHNDWLALKVIRVLEGAGLRVPKDISVMGVDNSPSFNALCPEITTLAYPYGEIAEIISGSVASGRQVRSHRLKPFRIIEGRTVCPPCNR
jgi:LacI family transcriptional regulator